MKLKINYDEKYNSLLLDKKENEKERGLLKTEHDKIKNAITLNQKLEMELQKKESALFQREINEQNNKCLENKKH